MRPILHIYLLGDFLLVSDDTPMTTVTVPRLQSLLAYLVLHQAAPQDRSHLAFLLWPDSTEAQAHTNLRKLLYQLRHAFPNIDSFLHADKHSLQWLPAQANVSWVLDVQEFERALARAKQAEQTQDTTAIRQALEQAIQLYRGDLLPSCYDEWILPERDRLRQLCLQAIERLIALQEQERDYDAAIRTAHQLLHQDPLHEATYRQLMRLYVLQGDRAAALRVYHACASVLERELGTEPSAVTQAAYESLVPSKTPLFQTSSDTSIVRETAAPLIGRKAEWRRLQEAWRKAADGQAHVVLLSGEAGIGKTRLAEEMEAWVRRLGMSTASARCYATLENLAYAPVTAWLRGDTVRADLCALGPARLTEIARLMPEILVEHPKLPRPTAMTESWQRQHFFEALARSVLSTRQPLLLMLDDVQWCDHETLQWLHYLLRFEPEARFLLLGTVRLEETLPEHPLVAFLGALQRDGLVTEIPLGPLTATETLSLAEQIMGHQLDSVMHNTLFSETEGNPLFVVEMARAGTLGHCQGADSVGRHAQSLLMRSSSSLPQAVQSVLVARFSQLSSLARDVANVAAVIGREFPFPVLVEASGQSEDAVVQGLDELWQRRIVREQGVGTAQAYDFSHDKLRELAYASLSPAYQRLLHRRVAEAFEQVCERDMDAVSGQIAAHYERAGLPERAIPYYYRAGKVASRLYANPEAMTAFERARVLLEAHTMGQSSQDAWATSAQVYESLGDVSLEMGRYQEARLVYQRAMACVPEQECPWQARLHCKIANSWNHASSNPHDSVHANARQEFQEAEHILTQASDPSNPAWRQEWMELQFAQIWPLRGTVDDMTAAIEKARPLVEQYGTQQERERLSFALVMRDLISTRFVISEQQLSSLRAGLAALQQTEDKSKLGIGYLALGGALLFADHVDEAEEQLEKALRVGEDTGIAWLQSRSLTFLSLIYRRRGQVEQMRKLLTRAQAVGAAQNNDTLTGHCAWLAWRNGNMAEAENDGKASIEQRESNPFQWTAHWPLIGVALAQQKIAVAMNEVRMLLDPSQQPHPQSIRMLLEASLQAWDAGQQQKAHMLLQQALPLAEEMGYL